MCVSSGYGGVVGHGGHSGRFSSTVRVSFLDKSVTCKTQCSEAAIHNNLYSSIFLSIFSVIFHVHFVSPHQTRILLTKSTATTVVLGAAHSGVVPLKSYREIGFEKTNP